MNEKYLYSSSSAVSGFADVLFSIEESRRSHRKRWGLRAILEHYEPDALLNLCIWEHISYALSVLQACSSRRSGGTPLRKCMMAFHQTSVNHGINTYEDSWTRSRLCALNHGNAVLSSKPLTTPKALEQAIHSVEPCGNGR